jgi:CysZ protein
VKFFKELYISFISFWEAIFFIKKHKLYWFVVFPLIIMLAIYKFGYMIQNHQFIKNVSTMNEIVWYLIELFLELTISMVFMNFSKYLMVALMSPILTYISQKTETLITNKKFKTDFNQFKKDIIRAIKIVIRNLIWYYLLFILFFGIAYIFWEEPKSSPVFFITYIVCSYYYGFSFIDYVNERRKLSVKESILYLRKHYGLAIGIGGLYSLMIFVPVDLGVLFLVKFEANTFLYNFANFVFHLCLWLIAAFAPIIACVSATIAMNKIVDKNE